MLICGEFGVGGGGASGEIVKSKKHKHSTRDSVLGQSPAGVLMLFFLLF